jgi:hypothetical protein
MDLSFNIESNPIFFGRSSGISNANLSHHQTLFSTQTNLVRTVFMPIHASLLIVFALAFLGSTLAQAQSIPNNCTPATFGFQEHRIRAEPEAVVFGQPVSLRFEGYLPQSPPSLSDVRITRNGSEINVIVSPLSVGFAVPSFYCQSRALEGLAAGIYAANLLYHPIGGTASVVASTRFTVQAAAPIQLPTTSLLGKLALTLSCLLFASLALYADSRLLR